MPSGIVLTSLSPGATQESIEKVLTDNGYEVEKEAVERQPEPERDAFESEEDFEAAHEDWQKTQPEEKQDEQEGEEEREPAPKLSRTQRKIQRATDNLQRENAELKRRLDAIDKGGKKEEEASKRELRPKRSEFTSDEQYEDALLGWGTKKALAENQAREFERSQRESAEEILNAYKGRIEDAKDKYEDFDEVVSQDLPMHHETQLAIMEQENGAEVVYYLGKNPEYTKKLAQMTPLSAVMEVGRLSARLKTGAPRSSAANGRANDKPKPRAPAPVRPVSTAATSSSLTSTAAAARGDYKAFRAAQRMGR